jgi:hypothetical protein
MKLQGAIAATSLLAITAFSAQAAELNRDFLAGRDYYMEAEFKKAAVRFQASCTANNDAEACYWTGLSYERMADTQTPFGCWTDAKAHRYLAMAVKLAPGLAAYRDALFDFLLDTADCSRTALREAAGILSATPQSDPGYDRMRSRLEQERHANGSVDARLARLFLSVPRATYRIAALPGAVAASARQ